MYMKPSFMMATLIIWFEANSFYVTFGSCFKYKSGQHGTCLAMNGERFMFDVSKRVLIHMVIPVWYLLFTWEPYQDGTPCMFIFGV